MLCPGCYAYWRAITRFRGRFGYPKSHPFKVVVHEDKLEIPLYRNKPTLFFFCSMGEWLAPQVQSEWRRKALAIMKSARQHIFITLTKQYDNLSKIQEDSPDGLISGMWFRSIIPPNVWVGISVTKQSQIYGIQRLGEFRDTPNTFISFEPLLEDLAEILKQLDQPFGNARWIIIGARTKQGPTPGFIPQKEWVEKLVDLARQKGILVFLKPNLKYLQSGWFPNPIEEVPFHL